MQRAKLALTAAVGLVAGTSGLAAAGGGWTTEPIPSKFQDSSLSAVTAGDGQTWAFGSGDNSTFPLDHSQAFQRGPQGWHEVPVPDVGDLTGADVVSGSDVWAVGSDSYSGVGGVVHWDGTKWTKSAPDVPAGNTPGPADVRAFAADDVWTTGEMTWQGQQDIRARGMIQHWDGKAWTDIRVPAVSQQDWTLTGIGGVSSTDLWAVGEIGNAPDRAVALHWDGKRWTQVPTPAGPHASLSDVTALAPDDVWASGSLGTAPNERPLVLHWDGTKFSRVALPGNVTEVHELIRVGDEVWALGNTASEESSVLRYHQHRWQPMPSPSGGTALAGTALPDGGLVNVGYRMTENSYTQPFVTAYHG